MTPGKSEETKGTIDPEEIIANAYQVIGSLSEIAGVFDHPEIQRALDYLGFDDRRKEPLCPWPRTPIVPFSSDRDRLEKRVREAEAELDYARRLIDGLLHDDPALVHKAAAAFLASSDKQEAGE